MAATARATTIIDKFADDQFAVASGVPGSVSAPPGSVPAGVAGNILGGFRDLFVEKLLGSNKLSKTVKGDVDASTQTFTLSRDGGIGGRGMLQWEGDGFAPIAFDPRSNLSFLLGGGSAVDLTTGGEVGLLLRVLGADLPGQQVRITLFGPNNTVASDAVVTLPAVNGGPLNVQIPFASFSKTLIANGAVFNAVTPALATQVYAITMALTGPDSSDISIGQLSTYAPEPTSAALFGLGIVGLLGLKRKRRLTS